MFGLLCDAEVLETDPARLPNTSYPAWFEAAASGVFLEPITFPDGMVFGTRCQTVVALWRDGRAELRERFRTRGGEWTSSVHAFRCEPGAHDDALAR